MERISDIKINGIDVKRPPVIRKQPYIDIHFKLSHQAPAEWCRDFNALLSSHPTAPKIKEKDGLYIDAWVRSPDEITTLLLNLKKKITECNLQYIERIERTLRESNDVNALLAQQGGGEQERLNRIIAELNYDDN